MPTRRNHAQRFSRLVAGLAATLAAAFVAGSGAAQETDPALTELGKRLFYDARLSGNAGQSCASCHQPDRAFTDGQALSDAYAGLKHFRNTPTLANVGEREAWLHDGRLGTDLNDVTRGMIVESYLMNMDMRLMQERLKQDPTYREMFAAAGLGEPSNGGARAALAAFTGSIVSRGAEIDADTLSDPAARGQIVFEGKAGCAECHSGPRYTDDLPHNTGVPDNPDIWSDPERHSAFVAYAKFMGVEDYMDLREDLGAYVRTHEAGTERRFLTPTLRELTYTAPHMHNGIFATLDEVIEFYDQGGGDDPLKDERLQPLNLADEEKADLQAFLETLSGDSFDIDAYVWREDEFGYEVISDWTEARN